MTVLLHSEYVLARRKSRIICFRDRRQTLTAKENCEMTFSKNITIDNLGQVTIELGDHFSFPDNFEKLFNNGDMEWNSAFQVILLSNSYHKLNYTIEMASYSASELQRIIRRKKIRERTVKELVGSSLEKFLDSDRYKTTVKKS